jgi:LuxR family transcriptional regulator, quorum-sensing system regulator CciR
MTSMALVREFISSSAKSRDFSSLHAILEAVTLELGFRHFALLEHVDMTNRSPDTILLHSYPEHWMSKSIRTKRYSSDPVHVASYKTHIGFAWADVGKIITLSPLHKEVLDEARRSGIGEGFTVPAHIPGETNGTCSFALPSGRALCPEALPAAQLIGSYAFEAARVIAQRSRRSVARPPVHLTNRQLECLVLVAKGKSDWEIATILGIKEDTVSEHLNDARRRYDVERRIQLLTHALHDGHLALSDALN